MELQKFDPRWGGNTILMNTVHVGCGPICLEHPVPKGARYHSPQKAYHILPQPIPRQRGLPTLTEAGRTSRSLPTTGAWTVSETCERRSRRHFVDWDGPRAGALSLRNCNYISWLCHASASQAEHTPCMKARYEAWIVAETLTLHYSKRPLIRRPEITLGKPWAATLSRYVLEYININIYIHI